MKKIAERIFEEMFRQKIDEFERRIAALETEVAVLKKTVTDHEKEIDKIHSNMLDAIRTSARMEGAMQTVFMFLKPDDLKKLGDADTHK